MAQPIEELQRLTATTVSGSQMLDQEELEIEASLRTEEDRLYRKRRERLEMEQALTQEERPAGTLEETFRFIGRVEQSLKNIESVSGDDGLEIRLKNLREEYLATKANIDEKGRRAAEDNAHRAVARLISHYAEFLSAEGCSDNPEIDPRELNIRFTRARERRRDYLWEIGSGANWMAYHLATALALHEYMLKVRENGPVPTFLVVDQPSQVYFPSDKYEAQKDASSKPETFDDDMKNTRRIFEVLDHGLKRTANSLQIIITEHADQDAWDGIESISVSANWHGVDIDYLIPASWTRRAGG
jgi:hypothetical protein